MYTGKNRNELEQSKTSCQEIHCNKAVSLIPTYQGSKRKEYSPNAKATDPPTGSIHDRGRQKIYYPFHPHHTNSCKSSTPPVSCIVKV